MPQQQINGFQAFTITSVDKTASATFIPERGGVGSSIMMNGRAGPRELLFLHENFWEKTLTDLPGGWPFLFPICARLERQGKFGAYLLDGKIYELPIHGLSWNIPWMVEYFDDQNLIMKLESTKETKQHYPFDFTVTLHYTIKSNELVCHQNYANLGDQPMPYYAGFHPYFLMPAIEDGKAQVQLDYSPVKRFKYNENYTDLVGEQPLFQLPVSVSDPEINEQLTLLGENKLINLHFPNSDNIIMQATGIEDINLFPYVQLYTMPDKPFFCVEPWMGFPNAMNTVKGVRWLAPGQNEQGVLTLLLLS